MKKVMRGLKIAVLLWVLLFLGGFLYARLFASNFTHRSSLEAYLSSRAALATTYFSERRGGGLGIVYFKKVRVMLFACGPDTYVYDESQDAVRVTPTPQYMPPEPGTQAPPLDEARIAAAGAALGMTLESILPPQPEAANSRLSLIAGGVGGVGLGYRLGYREVLDCGDSAVQHLLKEDKDLWKHVMKRDPRASSLLEAGAHPP